MLSSGIPSPLCVWSLRSISHQAKPSEVYLVCILFVFVSCPQPIRCILLMLMTKAALYHPTPEHAKGSEAICL